jgi:tRNA (adenine37-N6)-methyltransferase
MSLKPIGIIHSPYKNKIQCPPQGREEICCIEIFEQFAKGPKHIDGFSHLIVLQL